MELRHLRYVVAASEEGSFTAAAATVHVAQPAISQQIAQLERELGARLFDRSDRRAQLTVAGDTFLPYARAALEAAAAGRDAVESLRGELVGELTVGTIPSPAPWLIEHLGAFRRLYPRVRLTLRTGDPESLAAAVTAGTLDAAVIGISARRVPAGPAGQQLRPEVASQAIASEPLVIAVAPDHPLAGAAGTSLWRVRHDTLVTLTPATGLRSVLESACAEAGFTPHIGTETDDLTVVADLVAHGLGVALLPRSTARQAGERLVMLRLRKPRLERRMELIWRRQRVSAPGRAFLDMVKATDDAASQAATDGLEL